jgi:hypothetical protein
MGMMLANGSSPGWGGRNVFLNRGFLSPLPGLGKFAGGLTHSWRYGLLPRAAPQLKIEFSFSLRLCVSVAI